MVAYHLNSCRRRLLFTTPCKRSSEPGSESDMISQNNCHQTAASKSAQRCALIGGAAGAITICIGNGAALVITTKACYAFRNSCGSFAMLAAIRRASSLTLWPECRLDLETMHRRQRNCARLPKRFRQSRIDRYAPQRGNGRAVLFHRRQSCSIAEFPREKRTKGF
jgi:hypothetical protein